MKVLFPRAWWLLILTVAVAAPTFAQSMPSSTAPASSVRGAVGQFLGGVPTGAPTPGTLHLTILDAMTRALDHNLGVLTANADVGRARGARLRELAALLPNVSAHVTETRLENNLQAFGFGTFPSPLGTGFPTIVGPFNVFDARASVSQAVVDLGALNHTRSEEHNAEAARQTYRGARDFVIWVAGDLYLNALAASARVDAAQAQQQTAQTLYNQAVDLRQSGIVAGIDVLRAEVQLNTQLNRTTTATNDFEKAKLRLARVIGLPLGQEFELDPKLPELPAPDMTLDEAEGRALQARADYQAALERVRAAQAARAAIVGEALPAVRVSGDFGDIGLSPSDSHSTFSVTGAVQIPIFQGGRIRGRLAQADADLRDRQAEADDLRAGIYYDVRMAFLDLRATNQQLQVATKARDLASQQLTQSRDRFAAGIADNVEVVQAQEAVAVATEQYISALYGYDLAKGALIRGMGTAEDTLRQYLGGSR